MLPFSSFSVHPLSLKITRPELTLLPLVSVTFAVSSTLFPLSVVMESALIIVLYFSMLNVEFATELAIKSFPLNSAVSL